MHFISGEDSPASRLFFLHRDSESETLICSARPSAPLGGKWARVARRLLVRALEYRPEYAPAHAQLQVHTVKQSTGAHGAASGRARTWA